MTRHLTFTSCVDKMEGGTTLPWLIEGITDDRDYERVVLKLFRQERYGDENPTLNEFLATFIAREFDLECPEAFILTFDELDARLMSQEFSAAIVAGGGIGGAYFCSKHIDGALPYAISMGNTDFAPDHYECIYAFDVLIRNTDRRVNKPNLLISSGHSYLIDHEQCFFGCDNYQRIRYNQPSWNFINPGAGIRGPHLFLSTLKRQKRSSNRITFDTFVEGLSTLNLNNIEQEVRLLERYDIDISNWYVVKNYLQEVRQDIPGFIQLLNELIERP